MYSQSCHHTYSLSVKQTYRCLHSINILQLHIDTHHYEHKRSAFLNNLHSVLLEFININCFDRPMLRLLNAFPQKRKCYFYPQCLPLSCDAVGLDSYRDCPTINILSGELNTHTAHTHPENIRWESWKSHQSSFLSNLYFSFHVVFFCRRAVQKLKPTHSGPSLSRILSNSMLPVCAPFSQLQEE